MRWSRALFALLVAPVVASCVHTRGVIVRPEYEGERLREGSLVILVDDRVRIGFEGELVLPGEGDQEERILAYFKHRLLDEARSRAKLSRVSLETTAGLAVDSHPVEVKAARNWTFDLDVPVEGAEFRVGWGRPDFVLIISNVSLGTWEATGVEAWRGPGPYRHVLVGPTLRLNYRSSFLLWDNQRHREVARGFSDGSFRHPAVTRKTVWGDLPAHFNQAHWRGCSDAYLDGVLGALPF